MHFTARTLLAGIVTTVFAIGAVALAAAPPAADPSGAVASYSPIATWRSEPAPAPGGVVAPSDLDVAPDESVVVLDRALERAQRFDAEGKVTAVYGLAGTGGALSQPLGLAVDAARDRLYVADTGHKRVAVFKLDGSFETGWGDFTQPEAVTVGLDGRLYTYDRGVHGIKVRKPDGGDEGVFPVQVAQARIAELPRGITTSDQGTIFFAAEAPVVTLSNVLYEYTAAGLIKPPRTQIAWQLRDLAFGAAGQLLVLDGTGHRLVTTLNRSNGQARGSSIAPGAVAVAGRSDGRTALLYKAVGIERPGLRQLAVTGDRVTELERRDFPAVQTGWFDHPVRLERAAGGSFLVLDILGRVQHFSADGQSLGQISRPGVQEALLASDSRLYLVRLRTPSPDDPNDPDGAKPDERRYRVEAYDLPKGLVSGPDNEAEATLAWTREWTEPLDAQEFTQIVALVFDAQRRVLYGLDGGRRRLMRWDDQGKALADVPLHDPDKRLPGFTDLAQAPNGTLYTLHSADRRVNDVPLDGSLPVDHLDVVAGAHRLAARDDGALLVLAAGRKVVEYPATGQIPSGTIQLPAEPDAGEASDIAVGSDGRVYVADYDPRAVHVFGTAAPPHVYIPLAWRP